MSFKRISTFLRGFRDDQRGIVAVESIIVLPLLFWSLMAMYAFFDAYRQAGMNVKAAYTIGDLLSRETNYITPEYLETTHQLFDLMTRSNSESKMRVTVVKWNEDKGSYDHGPIDWDEFWRVVKGHGPMARDRVKARKKAWDDGEWVREAALAHAAKRKARAAAPIAAE